MSRSAGRGRSARAVLAALTTGATAVAGCSGESSASCQPSEIPDHDETTLIIEGDAWSGYAPFRDEGLLDGTGYTAVYVEQVCQEVRAADLTAGRADIAVTTLDQYLLQHPEGALVGIIDQSLGADALALGTANHPELDSIDDLPTLVAQFAEEGDKPVLAYTGSSPSEMLLNELANTTDELRLTDFELVSVDQSATAWEMLQADEAQLAVIWEPDTSAARDAGHTVALSSADVPDAIDLLIERDPAAVQAVVTSYYSMMDDLLARPAALERFYAEDGGLDAETARTLIAGIKLYGTGEADAFMNDELFPLDKPQIEQSINSIGSVLALIHPDIPLDQAKIDGGYVTSVANGAR
jgi:OmpA-OmpF porin, OOP family